MYIMMVYDYLYASAPQDPGGIKAFDTFRKYIDGYHKILKHLAEHHKV